MAESETGVTLSDAEMAVALHQAARDPRVLMCMDIGRQIAFEEPGVLVPTISQWELGLRLAAEQIEHFDPAAEELAEYQPTMSDAAAPAPLSPPAATSETRGGTS